MNNNVNIINNDCIDGMKEIDNETIDLIITSPPYWGQRDYENNKQWGNEKTIIEYIERMKNWANECKRVLKNSGCLFLNIGDKYSKKGLNLIPERIAIMMSDNGWILRNNIIWYKPNHMPSSIKDRFTNTYEYVYFFVKDSGKYFNYEYYQNIDILRIQPSSLSEKTKTSKKQNNDDKIKWPQYISIHDYENIWNKKIDEFNKNNQYNGKFKDQTINKGKSPGARSKAGIKYSLQRINKLTKSNSKHINEYLIEYYKKSDKNYKIIDQLFNYKDTASHWFRTDPGRSIPKPDDWFKLKKILDINDTKYDNIMTEQHYVLQSVKNNPNGKNPGDMWAINTEKCKESHFATFPRELPRKIINAFCPDNGTVLDTFAGSGTTGLVCKELNKKCVLIECNPNFIEIIHKRLQNI